MSNVHPQHSFYANDDWTINGTLYDVDDDLLDLTSVTLEWNLVDGAGVAVIGTADVTISVVDALLGQIKIEVPKTKTTTVAAGAYTDALRATKAGRSGTLWTGPILVKDEQIK